MSLSCTEQSTRHRKEIRAFVRTRNTERMKNKFSVVFHARLFIMPVTIFKPVLAYPCPAPAGAARTVPAARLLPRTGVGRVVSPVFPCWLPGNKCLLWFT